MDDLARTGTPWHCRWPLACDNNLTCPGCHPAGTDPGCRYCQASTPPEEKSMGFGDAAGTAQCLTCGEPMTVRVRARQLTGRPTTVAFSFDVSQAREHLATHAATFTLDLPPTCG